MPLARDPECLDIASHPFLQARLRLRRRNPFQAEKRQLKSYSQNGCRRSAKIVAGEVETQTSGSRRFILT